MKEMEQKNKFTKAKPSPENVAIQTLENCQTFIIMKSRNYEKTKTKKNHLTEAFAFLWKSNGKRW